MFVKVVFVIAVLALTVGHAVAARGVVFEREEHEEQDRVLHNPSNPGKTRTRNPVLRILSTATPCLTRLILSWFVVLLKRHGQPWVTSKIGLKLSFETPFYKSWSCRGMAVNSKARSHTTWHPRIQPIPMAPLPNRSVSLSSPILTTNLLLPLTLVSTVPSMCPPTVREDQVRAQIQSFWASVFAPSLKQAFDDCDCEQYLSIVHK
jgi:hypothetical protein